MVLPFLVRASSIRSPSVANSAAEVLLEPVVTLLSLAPAELAHLSV